MIVMLVNDSNISIYFDSFGVENIPKGIKKFIGNKNIITNVYRIEAYKLIMCGYLCIGFIDFMLKVKSLTDYTNLFSPNDYGKNDKIIPKYLQRIKRWRNYIALFAINIIPLRKKNSSSYYLQ